MQFIKNKKVQLILAVLALIALIGYYIFFYYSTCGFYKGMELPKGQDSPYDASGLIPEDLRDGFTQWGRIFFFENRAGNPVYVRINHTPEDRVEIIEVKCFDKRYINNSHLSFLRINAGMDLKDIIGIVGLPERFSGSGIIRAHFKLDTGGEVAIAIEDIIDHMEETDDPGNINCSYISVSEHRVNCHEETFGHGLLRALAKTLPYFPCIIFAVLAIVFLLRLSRQRLQKAGVPAKRKRTRLVILSVAAFLVVCMGLYLFLVKPFDTCSIRVGTKINVENPIDCLPDNVANSAVSLPLNCFCFYNEAGNIVFVRYSNEGYATEVRCFSRFITNNSPLAFRQITPCMELADVIKTVGMPYQGSSRYKDSHGNEYRINCTTPIRLDRERQGWIVSQYVVRLDGENKEIIQPFVMKPYLIAAAVVALLAAVLVVKRRQIKKS